MPPKPRSRSRTKPRTTKRPASNTISPDDELAELRTVRDLIDERIQALEPLATTRPVTLPAVRAETLRVIVPERPKDLRVEIRGAIADLRRDEKPCKPRHVLDRLLELRVVTRDGDTVVYVDENRSEGRVLNMIGEELRD
jgi:hypothetical protein